MADISIRKAAKRYGKTQVLHGVDLEIKNGEFLVILGPSGCGKSTLLRMIAGLETITDGEIAIGAKVVNNLEPRERGCAMVFQNYALYPHMTVADNIGYALKVAGVSAKERRERIEVIAKTVGLDELLTRKPGQLSGGQRQRVAMARAMIRSPQVFLFDEPLSNLDAKLRVAMRHEIRRLHQRLNATSVFVTHDQIEAMTLADRMVILNKGHIEQVGSPQEVYAQPASLFVAGFIGSPPMNVLDGVIEAAGIVRVGSERFALYDQARFAPRIGDAVRLGVRPEDVSIVEPGSPGALPLAIDFAEELGASRVIHGKLEAQDFAVAISDKSSATVTERTHVAFGAANVHLFDAKTGLRLLAPAGSAAMQPLAPMPASSSLAAASSAAQR